MVNKSIGANPVFATIHQGATMELKGEVLINAERTRVWHALNDPHVLMRCIPGCESVEVTSPTERHVRVLLKAGPVRARFVGKITLSDVVPDSSCVMHFEGSGGNAGSATGKSSVQLTTRGENTQVEYTATAAVAGKLGQIGARMLDAAAKQMADQFFSKLARTLNGDDVTDAIRPATAAHSAGHAATSHVTPHHTHSSEGGTSSELTRVLWFVLGSLATGFGVWLGTVLK
jgi:carbon monoxide dehydrogenase subunit G